MRRLEGNRDLLIGRSIEGGKLLRHYGPAHLLRPAPTRSDKGVGTIISNPAHARSLGGLHQRAGMPALTPLRKPARAICGPGPSASRAAHGRYNPLVWPDPASLDLAEDGAGWT